MQFLFADFYDAATVLCECTAAVPNTPRGPSQPQKRVLMNGMRATNLPIRLVYNQSLQIGYGVL